MTDTNAADGQAGNRAEDGEASDGRAERSNIDRRRTRARSSPSPAYLNRRKELIDAAARVMSRKGVMETTLGDIAQEAGTDRASIYYYVKGKEELLAEMLRAALTANTESFREIAAAARACLGQAARHRPPLDGVLRRELPLPVRLGVRGPLAASGHRLRGARRDDRPVAAGLRTRPRGHRRGRGNGEFRSALPIGVLAQSAIGLVAWTYRWYEPDHELTAHQIADGLADLLLSGLGASGAAELVAEG